MCAAVLSSLHTVQPPTNTFQAVVITDGSLSFALFIYRCGEMDWFGVPTVIGFIAETSFFANHRLADSGDAREIACRNSNDTVWSNVLYQIALGVIEPTVPPSMPSQGLLRLSFFLVHIMLVCMLAFCLFACLLCLFASVCACLLAFWKSLGHRCV